MTTKRQKYEAKKKKFKIVQHSFSKKIFNYRYCSGCGLVTLRNDRTRRAMARPCYSMEY